MTDNQHLEVAVFLPLLCCLSLVLMYILNISIYFWIYSLGYKKHEGVPVIVSRTVDAKCIVILESIRLPGWDFGSIFEQASFCSGCRDNPSRGPPLLCSQPSSQGSPAEHQRPLQSREPKELPAVLKLNLRAEKSQISTPLSALFRVVSTAKPRQEYTTIWWQCYPHDYLKNLTLEKG